MYLASPRKYVHEYVDRSKDPTVIVDVTPHRGATRQFPGKLYEMLAQASEEGCDDIVSWLPHGRSFLVRKPEDFVSEVMQRYFSQSKLTSFQRQLSLYGFSRITQGKDRGAYYNEHFLRGRPDLLSCIDRKRVKGTGSKLAASPETEPDFYIMEFCYEKSADGTPEESLTATVDEPNEVNANVTDDDASSKASSKASSFSTNRTPSVSSEDDSFEASVAASWCDEASVLLGDEDIGVQGAVAHAKGSMLEVTSFIHPSVSDVYEAELLAEFGQDVLGGGPTPAARPVIRSPAVRPSSRIGPLSIPGQFRNAFGKGIRSTCIHSADGRNGAVVKHIPMDLEMEASLKRKEQEYQRFQKPLENLIAGNPLHHVNWYSSNVKSASMLAQGTQAAAAVQNILDGMTVEPDAWSC